MDSPRASHNITQLLESMHAGNSAAFDKLFPLIYEELLSLARKKLVKFPTFQTFDSVALVNEVYINLMGAPQILSKNRGQFFALASKAMRRILIDYARRKHRIKRGGNEKALQLDEAILVFNNRNPEELIDLDAALNRLASINEEASKVVECRYFGGLTLEETAEALEMPVSRVRRRWEFARAWLFNMLYSTESKH